MGHIELASPVAHIWFLKSLPSKVGNLLDMTLKDLEKVLYFEAHMVVDPKATPLTKGQVLTEERYRQAREEYGDGFEAGIGAEAVQNMLRGLELEELSCSCAGRWGRPLPRPSGRSWPSACALWKLFATPAIARNG